MRVSDAAELVLLAALWGGSFLFMRIAAPVLGPIWLIECRVLLAGLVLLPVLVRLNLVAEMRRHLGTLILVGGCNSAIPFSLLAFASVSLPAGFTSILNATAPLFGTIIAAIWLKETLTLSRLWGLLLGFAGVVILVGWQAVAATPQFLLSAIAGLCAGLMYALSAPYIKVNLADTPPLVIATGSQLGAALVLLPALPFTIPTEVPSLPVILCVVTLALFSTSFAYILYFRLIRTIGSTRALTVTYLVPLFATLWGSLILNEAITPAMVAGGGLILLGTATANGLLPPRMAASKEPQA